MWLHDSGALGTTRTHRWNTAHTSFAAINIQFILESCQSNAVDQAKDRYSFLLLNVIKADSELVANVGGLEWNTVSSTFTKLLALRLCS